MKLGDRPAITLFQEAVRQKPCISGPECCDPGSSSFEGVDGTSFVLESLLGRRTFAVIRDQMEPPIQSIEVRPRALLIEKCLRKSTPRGITGMGDGSKRSDHDQIFGSHVDLYNNKLGNPVGNEEAVSPFTGRKFGSAARARVSTP